MRIVFSFFGWEQCPCCRGTKFFFGLLASAQCQRHWSVKIPFGFLPPKTALRIIYSPRYWIMFANTFEKQKWIGFESFRLRNEWQILQNDNDFQPLVFPRDGTSRCPFVMGQKNIVPVSLVPGQGQRQKSRDKLLSSRTTWPDFLF